MSHCLQMDIGNSSAKWRLVADGAVLARGRYAPGEADLREALLAVQPPPQRVWVSSVADPAAERELAELVAGHWGLLPWFARTPERCAGLVNSYADPSRMGVDRWLAMLGARVRDPGRLCVVDAGSALTIDLVAADGRHEGGYIVPGSHLMQRALLADTGRVRFEEAAQAALTPGTSTAEAVSHGIALAQAGAVSLALERAGAPSPALWFCGGGGEVLRELLGRGGKYVQDLVFEGLEVMAGEVGG